ncbi:MAG: hypothetical protein AB2A00_00195 [Myxococcota bacterium]
MPLFVMALAGEFTTVDRVVMRQAAGGKDVLYGPAFSNPALSYKLKAVLAHRASVLALGSSRVMQLRRHFFIPGTSFYNGGGVISRLVHFRYVLGQIPAEARPTTLLLGLDQWFFNAKRETFTKEGLSAEFNDVDNPLNITQRNHAAVLEGLWNGRISAGKVLSHVEAGDIGITAIMASQGFRPDGSYRYGRTLANPDDPEGHDPGFRDTLQRIREGNRRFEWADDLAPEAMAELAALLKECRRDGIRVVAYLPPFAPSVLARMRESGHYAYVQKIALAVRPLFDGEQSRFYDFTDVSSLGADDREFIDGFHGSEKTDARLLVAMAADGALPGVVDARLLTQWLTSSSSRFELGPAPTASLH